MRSEEDLQRAAAAAEAAAQAAAEAKAEAAKKKEEKAETEDKEKEESHGSSGPLVPMNGTWTKGVLCFLGLGVSGRP